MALPHLFVLEGPPFVPPPKNFDCHSLRLRANHVKTILVGSGAWLSDAEAATNDRLLPEAAPRVYSDRCAGAGKDVGESCS